MTKLWYKRWWNWTECFPSSQFKLPPCDNDDDDGDDGDDDNDDDKTLHYGLRVVIEGIWNV